jgi:uncharacterized membrane protein YvbJ
MFQFEGETMAFCSKCGKQLADNAKFCASCGASADGTASGSMADIKKKLNEGKEKINVFMEEHEVKEKINAGKEKVNTKIKGLAFRRIVEKKIPAETRAKFPVLDKLIPLTNYIVCALAVLLVIIILSASGGSSPKALAKQSFQVQQAATKAALNQDLSKVASLYKKAEKIQQKVKKLSEADQRKFEKELERLNPWMTDLDW